MKSIGKLIEELDQLPYNVYSYDAKCLELLRIFKDARETLEKGYMALPVDKDGEPVNVGDILLTGCNNLIAVLAITSKSVWYEDDDGEICCIIPSINCRKLYGKVYRGGYHHDKPRTVEDVLDDFARAQGYLYINQQYKGITDYNELRAQYAAELRMRDES